ncbi:MAG: hypothetical protein WHV67_01475, partial [Thermoanaerobaculia bacterium]
GGTRYVNTSPPGYLQNCINLGGSGETTNVRGAAVDGVRGYAYFAQYYFDRVPAQMYIKKVDTNCTSILDSDYGNQNGSWGPIWNTIVGMVVDETNGDLYIATKTSIQKVNLQENTSVVKAGFGNIYGIDLIRENAQEPGFLLIADAGAGYVKAIALDNLGSTPINISSAPNLRTAIFGKKPGNGQEVISSDTMIYLGILHNYGNTGATSPVLPNKLIEVWPKQPAYIWISAPEGGRMGSPPQGWVRKSDQNDTSYSTAKVYMKYKDGKARYTCALTGDPGRAAPYDPLPANLQNCDRPYKYTTGMCDNRGIFSTNGTGSFIDNGQYKMCYNCGSDANICKFEFKITQRYAGDNYKVYFETADFPSKTYFARATPIYTAVKHIHIERDKMCRNGGLLFKDYGAIGECGGTGQPACCGTGTELPCNQIMVYDWMNGIGIGNPIKIFDETKPFESFSSEVRTVQEIIDNADETTTITLDSPLIHSYYASSKTTSSPKMPMFDNGHSAGLCYNSSLQDNSYYFVADTSDLGQPFSDGFVTFHITKDGFEGSNVVPYLPEEWFNTGTIDDRIRFHNIWFKNLTVGSGTPPTALSKNYFHIIGASKKVESGENIITGLTGYNYDYSYILIKSIEDIITDYCNGLNPQCTQEEKSNYINLHNRNTTGHETAHQFNVNSGGSCIGGHCTNNAWCGGAGGSCRSSCGGGSDEWCLMHSAGEFMQTVCQRVDGIDKMDCSDLSANSLCIEPDCSGSNQISVRTDYDPE